MGIDLRAAIAGIGHTEFSTSSGRSEQQLACEASLTAIADTGLAVEDIDGIVKYDLDSTEEVALARMLGIPNLSFYAQQGYGGGAACAVIQTAAMAVATGMAKHVLVFRALNERSGTRFGTDVVNLGGTYDAALGYVMPYGMMVPAQFCSLQIHRYLHDYGIEREALGHIATTSRAHASRNPHARFRTPMSLDDYQASRWIVEPVLRLFDCCMESDGAVAFVVTSSERARDLRQTPVRILSAAMSTGPDAGFFAGFARERIYDADETRIAAAALFASADLAPSDVDVALLYDAFSVQVAMQLEAYGFCGEGEGVEFCRDGRISIDGELPVNTHGGHLSEAYMHGQGHILEAVRQIRGASSNPVRDARVALVTAGVPHSGLLLGR